MDANDPLQDDKKPFCVPVELFESITDTLTRIRKVRERPLFVLIVDDIDGKVLEDIYSWRKGLREAGRSGGFDVLIHSSGGTLSDCYLAARLFCRCADSWKALVPKRAVSGATLICLGSSQITMCETAQLGPLDPQVLSRRREKFFASERQSPLEAFQAVRYLREYTIATLDSIMIFLLERKVAAKVSLETATKLAADVSRPILEKIDPYDLGSFDLDSQVAIEYCKRVGNPSTETKQTQRNVDPDRLVEAFPAHEFVIDFEEARSLGFSVELPSDGLNELFDKLRPDLANAEKYIGLIA